MIFLAAFVCAIIVAGASYASPYITVYLLQDALQKKNARAISTMVDFPAVKEGLKAVFLKHAVENAKSDANMNNGWAALGFMIGTAMINATIDTFVSPSGLEALYSGVPPSEVVASSQIPSTRLQPSEPDYQFGYNSFDSFVIKVKPRNEHATEPPNAVTFVLSRTGPFSWKVTSLEFQENTVSGRPNTQSSISTTQTSATLGEQIESEPSEYASNEFESTRMSSEQTVGSDNLDDINSQITDAYSRNDFAAAIPLYQRAINIIEKSGDRKALAEANKNYELLKKRVYHK